MAFYQTRGLIPKKRHTVFNRNASSIYYEELISRKGFSGIYSNVYHLRMPTKLESLGKEYEWYVEPYEGHGFGGEQSTLNMFGKVEEFLDKHLKN